MREPAAVAAGEDSPWPRTKAIGPNVRARDESLPGWNGRWS